MKTTNAFFLKTIVLVALGAATACQSTSAVNSNPANAPSNTAAVNNTRTETNPANKTAATPETAGKETVKPSDGSLATPTEAYRTAYAARQKKDVAGLKRVMSKDALEFFEMMTEPGKSIDDALLKMTETPQAATDESRNEKIDGDQATLEYPDARGTWKTMDFVKEGGDWKLTFPGPDVKGGKK